MKSHHQRQIFFLETRSLLSRDIDPNIIFGRGYVCRHRMHHLVIKEGCSVGLLRTHYLHAAYISLTHKKHQTRVNSYFFKRFMSLKSILMVPLKRIFLKCVQFLAFWGSLFSVNNGELSLLLITLYATAKLI